MVDVISRVLPARNTTGHKQMFFGKNMAERGNVAMVIEQLKTGNYYPF